MYKLPEDLESKYSFVTLASKRAEQLQTGARPRVAASDRKFTVVAQAEVAEGAVTVWEPEDEEILAATDEEEE
jgi:DNA-directed RNA polymerase omega subunit